MISSSRSTSADIVVVGAGIVGLACALRLQHEGLKVVLIERDAPGHGASFGNAGHIATEQIYPLASPQVVRGALSMLMDGEGALRIRPQYLLGIAPWLARFVWSSRPSAFARGIAALSALQSNAVADLTQLLRIAGASHLLHMDGHLVLIEHPDSRASAKREIDDLANHGIHARWLDARQVKELAPDIAVPIQGAYHYQGTGHVDDPLAVCNALFAAFQRAGGTFVQNRVDRVSAQKDEFTVTGDSGNKVLGKRVLLAAGAWSAPLAAQLGFHVPLDTERGYHITLPNTKPAFSIPVAGYERKIIMTPMTCGLRMTGTVEFGGLELPPDARRFELLRQSMRALLPDADVSTATTWMGFRPSLPDHLPVLGRASDGREIYFAFGHQHLGVTLAGVTARLIADSVNGRLSQDLTAYRADRF